MPQEPHDQTKIGSFELDAKPQYTPDLDAFKRNKRLQEGVFYLVKLVNVELGETRGGKYPKRASYRTKWQIAKWGATTKKPVPLMWIGRANDEGIEKRGPRHLWRNDTQSFGDRAHFRKIYLALTQGAPVPEKGTPFDVRRLIGLYCQCSIKNGAFQNDSGETIEKDWMEGFAPLTEDQQVLLGTPEKVKGYIKHGKGIELFEENREKYGSQDVEHHRPNAPDPAPGVEDKAYEDRPVPSDPPPDDDVPF